MEKAPRSSLALYVLNSAGLLIVLCGFSIFYFIQQNQLPTVMIDEVTWTQVLHWYFKNGFCPNGLGWGNWNIVDGMLEERDLMECSLFISSLSIMVKTSSIDMNITYGEWYIMRFMMALSKPS